MKNTLLFHSSKSLLLTFISLTLLSLLATVPSSHPTSALTYQNETDVEFTINPTISVSLSSSDIKIEDLAPGSSKDSNIVTVSVSTNAGYGYYLSATAGTKTTNTDLTNTADSTYKFTNLSSNAASLTNIPDNRWGYSYSTDNGTTWVSGNAGSTTAGYNGLPQDNDDNGATGITLINTDSAVASSSVKFKIGAKASGTQPSGTYINVVNFYAVTKTGPMTFDEAYAAAGKTKTNGYYTMQDATSNICSAVYTGAVGRVIDTRDNKTYKIAKLADDKCWMVENLNLAGGTALDADKTDVDASYISSFSTSNNLTKNTTNNTIVLPASSTSGFNSSNYSFVYNSGNKTDCGASGQSISCYSYYSWDAATLGSGRSISTDNTDAPYSICPKGWKLPTSRSTEVTNWQTTSDFYQLAHQYGLDSTTSTSESDDGFYTQAGPGTTPNFLLAGSYYTMNRLIGGGSSGNYWSSTSYSNTDRVRYLSFGSSSVNSAGYNTRYLGCSVRCLLK